jgi:hypothetical protein
MPSTTLAEIGAMLLNIERIAKAIGKARNESEVLSLVEQARTMNLQNKASQEVSRLGLHEPDGKRLADALKKMIDAKTTLRKQADQAIARL